MTTKEREKCSRKRQVLYKRLADWGQKVKDLEYEARVYSSPAAQDRLSFAKAEREKVRKEIFKLEQGNLRQRAWSGGGRI